MEGNDDELRLSVDGEVVYAEHLKLKPMEIFVSVIGSDGREGEVAVELGRAKLRWSSLDKERNRLNRPLSAPSNFDWDSAEGLFTAGEELAKERNYDEAMAKFQACLEKEPNHLRCLGRMAELCYRRAE